MTINKISAHHTLFRTTFIVLFMIFINSCQTNNTKEIENEPEFTNDLINETSPYLLQHAHNPVNWKPWGDKALKEAEKDNKLIIISIGYSACHWCHVMEEESFKNDSIAQMMNNTFVSIKVDKEERPDINQIYLNAVELMTGNGGWPLNCIALPDGRPVFGGTYFTKEQWSKALTDISTLYTSDPQKIIDFADKLTAGVRASNLIEKNNDESEFEPKVIEGFIETWNSYLDFENGGQQTENKYPLPNNLAFQLKHGNQTSNDQLISYVHTSLTKMAYGGIYDQIDGGFSRYAIDKKWHIPHFEKMLYDNAQLVSLYADAYLTTQNELYKEVVYETLSFVQRELTDSNGAFFSSIDADSQNEALALEEGAFYSWTANQLTTVIDEDDQLFENYYNINAYGLWEDDKYVLLRKVSDEQFAKDKGITVHQLKTRVKLWKEKLLKARTRRSKPRLDDKVLTSWNALMLKAYIDAYRVFDDENFLNIALKNAEFLLENQRKSDGGLNHNFKNGKSSINGYLEDYASIIDALIALYQVTFDEKWLETSHDLTKYVKNHFEDDQTSMFFFTSNDDADLITRKIEIIDHVVPSSNSLMAHNLFKLGHYYANVKYSDQARQMLNNVIPQIQEAPSAYSNWISLMTNYTSPYYEVAISGKKALELMKEINTHYLTNILLIGSTKESNMPLMANRFNENDTYIYVCVNGTCKLPVKKVSQAITQINTWKPSS